MTHSLTVDRHNDIEINTDSTIKLNALISLQKELSIYRNKTLNKGNALQFKSQTTILYQQNRKPMKAHELKTRV